jgi:GNAT superfamily N-acetyltransferase
VDPRFGAHHLNEALRGKARDDPLEGQNYSVPIVRDAVRSDADRIGEAHAEAWRRGYVELFAPHQLESAVDLRRRMWDGLVGDPALGGTLLVAEEQGDVMGFIHFGAATETPELGEVYAFYVHPDSWGTGSATDLTDAAVTAMADSFDRAILWTHSGAGRARRFYTKSGWRATGNERLVTTWDGLDYPALEYGRALEPRRPGQRTPC